jgi:hypothetical protein
VAVYFITGKLGTGKSLAAVEKIRLALEAGKKIATNLDIFPEHLVARSNRTSLIRLPDKPRLCDLDACGFGCDEPDYTGQKFGLMVLDELGTWFNTRSWNDKERLPVIDWFLHSRKKRWDVMFLVQDIEAVDKQLRDALCEHLVRCRRLDRFALPLVGRLIKMLTGFTVRMPQIHVASVYYEDKFDPNMFVERWWYRGRDLYNGYDTGQVFKSGMEMVGDELRDMRAVSTTLSAWHVAGRHPKPPKVPGLIAHLARMPWIAPAVLLALFLSLGGGRSPATRLLEWGLCRRRRVRSQNALWGNSPVPSPVSSDGSDRELVPGASSSRAAIAVDFFAWRTSGFTRMTQAPIDDAHLEVAQARAAAGNVVRFRRTP